MVASSAEIIFGSELVKRGVNKDCGRTGTLILHFVFLLKMAVTRLVAFTVQFPVPLHPPPIHPAKTDPLAAVAISLTDVEGGNS